MENQLTLLRSHPAPKLMQPVANPSLPGVNMIDWLKNAGPGYCGNKPTGGFWTSTHTPEGPYMCDWAHGLDRNQLIKLAYPDPKGLNAYVLTVNSDRILHVESLEDAVAFTNRYRRAKVRLPSLLLSTPPGRVITDEVTDWQRAFQEYDAIHFTASAADDAIACQLEDGFHTAFSTWYCESTLWGTWQFSKVELL